MPPRRILIIPLLFLAPGPPAARADGAEHWAFRKPVRPEVPAVRDAAWARTPIDAFVLARLEAKGLKPSPPADRLTLLRRVTFDLTGLPPSPEEADAFLKDESPDAYERVVDRLLASPHFGERWAQHWLDVVRYAETNGFEVDGERPYAWRYRDYVVRSFNADKPYDQFLTEQLAGDELARGKDPRSCPDLWLGTGMNRCGPVHLVAGNTDPEVNRQEVLTEMVNGAGSTFLGLTVACARCHDHKFDPISQQDYYSLQAFFAAAQFRDVDLSTPDQRLAHQTQLLLTMADLAPIKKRLADLEEPYRKRLTDAKQAKLEPKYREALAVPAEKQTPEQKELAAHARILIKVTWDEIVAALTPEDRSRRAALRADKHRLEALLPPPPMQVWAVADDGAVPPTHVLKRGDVKRKAAEVRPAYPGILAAAPAAGRLTRTDLAKWLTRPEHPLTARVMVNRLWQHHFGRGLVATPNDFGTRGAPPTHPELLDWLATELVREGWRMKPLHRLMVLSNTYRQSSELGTRSAERNTSAPRSEFRAPSSIDPDNNLLWRMNRRRLEGEAIRDAMLAASGALNREAGGPPVRVPLEPEVYDLIFTEDEPDNLWPVTPDAAQHVRRSLYLFAKRNVRQPLFEAFDQPDSLTSCPARPVSTFAPQALMLMNGPLARDQSRSLAARLLQTGDDPSALVEMAYRRALGRPPKAIEAATARTFLAEQAESIRDRLTARLPVSVPDGLPPRTDPALAAALADFCLALFNTNEFVYVP